MRKRGLLVAVLGALVLAPPAHAGGPTLLLGAAEDIVQQADPLAAQAQMDLFRLAGLQAVRVTAIWAPGETAPSAAELEPLRNAVDAAKVDGIRVYLSVYQFGSKTTPLTDEDQADFAHYAASLAKALPEVRHFIIGNEPNLNRFWLPQFNLDGSDAAAPAYETLLAKTYDALKAVSPDIVVIGGAVSPRGNDKPEGARQTHSPTTFIPDLGAAYRASGRTAPIMDQFAFHPYMDNSSQPPTAQHPFTTTVSINDYGKLVALLGQAFDGTAQLGSMLPILYDEFGVETLVPQDKAAEYTGTEPATTKPVDPLVQGDYYRQAIALAFCQPTVVGLFLFHTVDEPDLDRWQSGLFYLDGTAKPSLPIVRAAAGQSRRGVIAACPGLRLAIKASGIAFPSVAAVKATGLLAVRFRCNLDCSYLARLERFPTHRTVSSARGTALGGKSARAVVPRRTLAPGRYRFTLRLVAALNPGPVRTAASPPFRMP